jgi:putative methyltransferase (TIGR04325 family)
LGGNVGLAYYAYQKYLQYPDDLNWLVCEILEIVKAGEKIAGEKGINHLFFTSDFSQGDGYNILLSCGALQYIEEGLDRLLQSLNHKPKHILINHVPFGDRQSFITLQNIGYAFCPYKIQNKAEFVSNLNSLDYELIDTWKIKRNCIIPFRPDYFVSAYHGFYFRLKNS